jgi:TM2 domain-containing membrane protein YozV
MTTQPMPGQWMLSVNGRQHGPYDDATFRRMFAEGRVPANAMVWRVGMANWIPASQVTGAAPQMMPQMAVPAAARPQGSKTVAALIAFFFPGLHRAYLGKGTAAGIWFFAIYTVASCIISGVLSVMFGQLGLPCTIGLALVVSIAAVIDTLLVQPD